MTTPLRTLSKLLGPALCAALLVAPSRAHASGPAIYEADAHGLARAGANAANPDNPSAIFFNPAGIAFLPGLQLEIGTTEILPFPKYHAPEGGMDVEQKRKIFTIPHLYATYEAVPGIITAGLGVYALFGLGVKWPDDWAGAHEVEAVDLQTIFINPTVAVRPLEWMAFSVGGSIVPANAKLQRRTELPDGDARVTLAGDDLAYNWNVGLLAEPLSGLRFGLHYRSTTDVRLAGDAHFDGVPPGGLQLSLFDQPVALGIELPYYFVAGVGYDITSDWNVEYDFHYVGWSKVKELRIEFTDETSPTPDAVIREDWKDTMTFRFGTTYRLNQDWRVSAGYLFDQNPVPDSTLGPLLPDAHRNMFNVGGGYTFGDFTADLAYAIVLFQHREAYDNERFPAAYDTTAHLLSFSLTYRNDLGRGSN